MKGRHLYNLNRAIELMGSMGLGDNPTLSEIRAKLNEFNIQRQADKDQRDKPYKDKVGKIFLYVDDVSYKIFKVVDFIGGTDSTLGFGYTYKICYFVNYSFGSFTRGYANKLTEESFSIENIQSFVEIDVAEVGGRFRFKQIVLCLKTNSWKRLGNILNKITYGVMDPIARRIKK